jgi:hypothetical protein
MTRAELETLNILGRRGYTASTSLGMSRGIPGYPGGSPRGSAGEAGPMPPRPLRAHSANCSCRTGEEAGPFIVARGSHPSGIRR